MSQSLDVHHVGLTIGGLLGLIHFAWSIVVALGLAQGLIHFIFRLHMIQPSHVVLPFSLGSAIGLIALTSLIGYIVGNGGARLWNRVQKEIK